MRFSLAQLTRRLRNPRRKQIVLRDIIPPATLATDLFRSCYLPIVQTWQNAAAHIIAEYERSLSQLTTDAPADIDAVISSVQMELERLFIVLTPRLRDWALRTERWQRGKWRGAVLSATGVDLQTMIGPEEAQQTVESIISWNTGLIRDVSSQARQRISNSVFAGLHERKPALEVAADIRDAVAMSRRRSIGIASDQLSKISSALSAERRRQAGLDIYKYRHSGKLHPRSWHKARDGKLYADSSDDAGKVVDGQTVNAPIAADDRAGVPPWCGCREQGVVIFD